MHRPDPSPLAATASLWKDRLFALLPDRQALAAHPWLSPVANRLLDPQLWRLQQESVARGVAVGVFWAFVIPVAQILVAAAHCSWWRANIPVAAAMTMLTNPLTIGFWLWLAYQLGAFLLGQPLAPQPPSLNAASLLAQFGLPTLLGMGIFAVGGAAVGYVGVKLVWQVRVRVKRLRRIKSLARAPGLPVR